MGGVRGGPDQMKLRHLEMKLSKIQGFSHPSAALEQYITPAPLAARLLYTAWTRGDIAGKIVCDLGCGTGMIAIGAALLGADSVIGIDTDPDALSIAFANAETSGVSVDWIQQEITGSDDHLPVADAVVMNPPFGAQKEHADRPFIDAALTMADITYGIFNAGSYAFVKQYLHGRATIVHSIASEIPIKKTFSFHTRDMVEFPVEIFIIRRDS